ncbi:MAG: transposase [Elusimicrobia bacterium]|nr:transposase [Elusimicrobiota bacterium]
MEIRFRKNIRLKNCDYSAKGYYFATICADYRKSFFNNPQIRQIVVAELALLIKRFSGLKVDYYVIMPNHVHIIFVLEDSRFPLPKIIQAFKSITTSKAKQALPLQNGLQNGQRLWQPDYYEHVIRNERALSKIREYI